MDTVSGGDGMSVIIKAEHLGFTYPSLEDAPGERVSNGLLYSKYKEWCEDEERGYNPLGSTSFYNEMDRFYKRVRQNNARCFADVRLKD